MPDSHARGTQGKTLRRDNVRPDCHARGTQGKTLRRDNVRPDCHARGTQGTGQDSLGTESLHGIGGTFNERISGRAES